MTYVSMNYYIFVIAALILYYILPLGKRWIALLVANAAFYALFYKEGWYIFLITIAVSYLIGLAIPKCEGTKKKILLSVGIVVVLIPWLIVKNGNWVVVDIMKQNPLNIIVPMGISFYTLQVVAYLVDVYKEKIEAQKNPAKYALYVSFFPQMIQGPIPHYNKLADQLYTGHKFDEHKFTQGFCYILWGFFLKLVIADKAAVIVNTIYADTFKYTGLYLFVAAVLGTLQLYADFMACTTLSQGVAKMFGIELENNFAQPLLATSMRDIWKRWHMTLGLWLMEYIYFPLGGSRKGRARKYINLILTFIVCGFWHGNGITYLVWGFFHGFFQSVGDYTNDAREKIYDFLKIPPNSLLKITLKRCGVFAIMCGMGVFYRADTLAGEFDLFVRSIKDFNPWILFDDSLLALGLGIKEIIVLIIALLVVLAVSDKHEKGIIVSERVLAQKLPVRWAIYIFAIVVIMIFGTYGFGFNAQDFIYGGF